jgi:hypothetical protein
MKYLFKDRELKLVIQGCAIAALLMYTGSNLSQSQEILLGLSILTIVWQVVRLYMHAQVISKGRVVKVGKQDC